MGPGVICEFITSNVSMPGQESNQLLAVLQTELQLNAGDIVAGKKPARLLRWTPPTRSAGRV